MKVFVIPDIHLKPWIFDRAEEVSKGRGVDRFVCLMDIPDDFGKEFDLSLYESTFDRAIAFQKDHPDMLWAYGNHDICYLWNQRETGFSMLRHRWSAANWENSGILSRTILSWPLFTGSTTCSLCTAD